MIKRLLQRWLGIIDETEYDNSEDRTIRRARRGLHAIRGNVPKDPDDTSVDARAPNSFMLHVYPAAGGRVVEYKYNDPKIDEYVCSLHIIPADQDLHSAITKIITFEELRK
jgi:hypothetical protein